MIIQTIQRTCMMLLFAVVPLIVVVSNYWYVSPIFSMTFEVSTHTTTELYAKGKWLLFIVLSSILFCVTLYDVCQDKRIHIKKLSWLMILIIVSILLSSLLSTESYIALIGVGNRFDGAMTYIFMLLILWSVIHSDVTLSLKQLVILMIPFSIINVLLLLLNTLEFDFLIGQIGATVSNANVASSMFAMITILTVGFWIVEKQTPIFALIVINLIGLLLSVSAVGFILFVCGLIGLLFYTKAWIRVLVTVVAAFIVMMFLSPLSDRIVEESFGLFLPFETSIDERLKTKLEQPVNNEVGFHDGYPVLDAINTTALSSRVYIWEKTVKLIQEKPLFGYGLDTLRIHFPHFNEDARAGISSPGIIVDKAHNMYLGFIFGAGLIPFVLCMWLAMYIAKHIRFKQLTPTQFILLLVGLQFVLQGITNDLYMGLNTFAIIVIAVITKSVLRPKL